VSNLLSGLIGALLATALGAAFAFWIERLRLKAEVTLAVVGWADETYQGLYDLCMAKNEYYTKGKHPLEPAEYERNSRELRSMLLRNSVVMRVALVYGEGLQTALINEFRDLLLCTARKLWAAKQENWADINIEVLAAFEQRIDPLRVRLERSLLEQGSFPIKWLGIRKRLIARLNPELPNE